MGGRGELQSEGQERYCLQESAKNRTGVNDPVRKGSNSSNVRTVSKGAKIRKLSILFVCLLFCCWISCLFACFLIWFLLVCFEEMILYFAGF